MRYKNKYKSSENYQVSAKSDPKEIVYELLNGLQFYLSETLLLYAGHM